MLYVIGSGPSGVACASMLIQKGFPVTMLDVGLELEPERAKIVQNLKEKDPKRWDETTLKEYKSGFQVSPRDGECKPSYGSLFPYRDVSPCKFVYKNFKAYPSYARGGLSNVWGASVLAYLPEDIRDWPITMEELRPYYERAFTLMPVALDRRAPVMAECISSASVQTLRFSEQSSNLNGAFKNAQGQSSKIMFGGSKLALDAEGRNQRGKECIYCGLCMCGCPYALIYNSASTLGKLQKNKNFTYLPGLFVEQVKESQGEVRIYGRVLRNGQSKIFSAEKVYLACGVFSSARIMLRSYETYNRPLSGLDSHYFLLPLVSLWGTPKALTEDIHTLAHLCVWTHENLKKKAFLQIYGYNDLYAKEIKSRMGLAFPVMQLVLKPLLRRFFMIQAFLHSDDSSTFKIELKRDAQGNDELHLEGLMNPKTANALRDIKRELTRLCLKAKVFPLVPLMDVGTPGRGYHSGGTFPMRAAPRFGESDLWGRPHGFKNVHLVDSSVFPTIPAGPITLNAMANAMRIADQSVETARRDT